eukprot:TRINITY_DN10976_c0_g1_i1.p1 TRINITY_DN10976_c0_g1~~TRINITY_DN10976_c0_g1_i1.p1  ORF type:complete len:853 (+),score=157.26 TRINITY_DN10976_c0_g1_i1:467-3025(+)
MSVSIAGEWIEIHDCFYSKKELYTMAWQGVDLRENIVACAPFGGPIAVVRDQQLLQKIGGPLLVPHIQIFTSAGKLLAVVPFKHSGGRIVGLGWTEEENLACVVLDGTLYMFTIHGVEIPPKVSLGPECFKEGVARCCFWGGGLVVLTGGNQLVTVTDFKSLSPQKIPQAPPLPSIPHCMALIEPHSSLSANLEVLLGVGTTLRIVDRNSVEDKDLGVGEVQAIAVAPNGSLVAVFTSERMVLVYSSDFSRILSEFEFLEADSAPDQMVWCGADIVLLYWESLQSLLVVGPYGNFHVYSCDDPACVLVQESDGARIISNVSMEFLRRVPDSVVKIFQIGSTAPAALLFEALEHFEKRLAKADENIRVIGSELAITVETCIDAAAHEFDVAMQSKLVQAAAYGRAFCRVFPREMFRDVCKTLRILNAVRSADSAGMPLTYTQYQELTAPVLIARLVNKHLHLLASRLCQYLGLPEEDVLVHWASAKVAANASTPDGVLKDLLVSKLKSSPRISYATIAANIHKRGRPRLAVELVEFEPVAARQVELLVSMNDHGRALEKALNCGDTDLVYFVMFHMWETRSEKEFFAMLQAEPVARDLFIAFAREHKPETLKRYFSNGQQTQGVADLILREVWGTRGGSMLEAIGARGSARGGVPIEKLEDAARLYKKAPACEPHAKAALECAQLLKLQVELENASGQTFCGLSVSETIRKCLALGNQRMAQRVRNEMKVPDKRFYWIKARALAKNKEWEALERFSKEKKPPTGFRPFVDVCIEEKMPHEAAKYIPKLTDLQEQAEAYMRLGLVDKAADVAKQAKDGAELFNRLKSTFANQSSVAASLFESLIDRVSVAGVNP